jgi:hypothetical protein
MLESDSGNIWGQKQKILYKHLICMPLLKFMVRPARLELARVLPHSDLNAARLPIPPRPHAPTHSECLAMKVSDANRRLKENSSVENI